ncbi:unnamed protein product [Lasius platythorax]|uniref:Uncharacterized protein n=1 Tax=Lasius platythorax TaxID=488582 RepID=A0AAV2N466_9HYME
MLEPLTGSIYISIRASGERLCTTKLTISAAAILSYDSIAIVPRNFAKPMRNQLLENTPVFIGLTYATPRRNIAQETFDRVNTMPMSVDLYIRIQSASASRDQRNAQNELLYCFAQL